MGRVRSRSAFLPTQRALPSNEATSSCARLTAASCKTRLRWPIERSAQLTPCFTKFRSSVAARSTHRRLRRNGASLQALSCNATHARSANAARLQNSSRRSLHAAILPQACGVRSNNTKQAVSQIAQLSKSRHHRSTGQRSRAPGRPPSWPTSAPRTSRTSTARQRGCAALEHRERSGHLFTHRLHGTSGARTSRSVPDSPCGSMCPARDATFSVCQWERERAPRENGPTPCSPDPRGSRGCRVDLPVPAPSGTPRGAWKAVPPWQPSGGSGPRHRG